MSSQSDKQSLTDPSLMGTVTEKNTSIFTFYCNFCSLRSFYRPVHFTSSTVTVFNQSVTAQMYGYSLIRGDSS